MTATFTSPDGPSLFSVTTTFFSTLTDHILYDSNGAPDRLAIEFDRPLSRIQLTFATKGPGFFTLTAFLGAERVGSLSFLGAIPAGLILPEGHALFEDTPFDNVLLSSTASDFAVDDVTVRTVASVPEPAAVLLVAMGLLLLAPVMHRRRRDRPAFAGLRLRPGERMLALAARRSRGATAGSGTLHGRRRCAGTSRWCWSGHG
jgi:hypothetical protein